MALDRIPSNPANVTHKSFFLSMDNNNYDVWPQLLKKEGEDNRIKDNSTTKSTRPAAEHWKIHGSDVICCSFKVCCLFLLCEM